MTLTHCGPFLTGLRMPYHLKRIFIQDLLNQLAEARCLRWAWINDSGANVDAFSVEICINIAEDLATMCQEKPSPVTRLYTVPISGLYFHNRYKVIHFIYENVEPSTSFAFAISVLLKK